jgi:cell growth-regulating nucleolar protein
MTATTQNPVQPNSSAHRTAEPTLDSAQTTALVPRSVDSSHDSAAIAVVDAPPRAPTPPPAVNVFDFLVADGGGATDDEWESDGDNDMHVERYTTAEAYASNGFVYGSHPVPATFERYASHSSLNTPKNPYANAHATPAPRSPHGRTVSLDSTAKKSGKRKRGPTLDTSAAQAHSRDVVMTDVPPATGSLHHSSLTGGLHRLMSRPDLPPSPDLSGGADSPSSPIKRSRRDGARRSTRTVRRASDEAPRRSKDKVKHAETARRHGHREDDRRERRDGGHHRSARKRSASPKPSPPGRRAKQPKHHVAPREPSSPEPSPSNALVRVPPPGALATTNGSSTAMVSLTVEHAPTSKGVDRFLDCLVKGSEREEGVSLWRALKRWKRDGESGEKELWKGLKVRVNERGEMVLCV